MCVVPLGQHHDIVLLARHKPMHWYCLIMFFKLHKRLKVCLTQRGMLPIEYGNIIVYSEVINFDSHRGTCYTQFCYKNLRM